MDKEWLTAFTTDKMYMADMARALLEAAGIDSLILNKQDSTLMIGDIEIRVKREHLLRAKYLLNNLES